MARTDELMYEYACHEGNYDLPNILSIARNLERQAAEREQAGIAVADGNPAGMAAGGSMQ